MDPEDEYDVPMEEMPAIEDLLMKAEHEYELTQRTTGVSDVYMEEADDLMSIQEPSQSFSQASYAAWDIRSDGQHSLSRSTATRKRPTNEMDHADPIAVSSHATLKGEIAVVRRKNEQMEADLRKTKAELQNMRAAALKKLDDENGRALKENANLRKKIAFLEQERRSRILTQDSPLVKKEEEKVEPVESIVQAPVYTRTETDLVKRKRVGKALSKYRHYRSRNHNPFYSE